MSSSAVLNVRVTPRSSREAVEGVDEAGELRVRVTAPPADGSANAAVVKLLARTLGVPKGAVRIVSGAAGRHKRVAVDGISARDLRGHWPGVRASDT